MIDEKEKTLRDFVHEAIVPLIEDVLVKKLYQALEVVVSEIKPPRKEWVSLTDEEITEIRLSQERDDLRTSEMLRKVEAKLKEKNQ